MGEDSFELYYAKNKSRVRSQLYKMLLHKDVIDDLTQEVFVKVWRQMNKVAEEIPTAILFKITLHTAFDFYKKKKLNYVEVGSELVSGVDSNYEQVELVRKALLQLPLEERSLIVLQVYEGLTLEELARIYEVPVGTIKSRLFTVKEKLTEIIKNLGGSL